MIVDNTWNPHPESGTLSYLTVYSDLSVTTLSNSLADRQSKTCSLYEVVDLEEAVKDFILYLWSNTLAGILAVDIKSLPALSLLELIA
jgi:hypothetical protein